MNWHRYGRVPKVMTGDEADETDGLRDHLIDDHGRSAHELTGLPLSAVHELEHFDEAAGLLRLQHRHRA